MAIERDVIARLLGHLMHPAATHEVVEDLRFTRGDDGDVKAVRARIGGEVQQVTAALHRDDMDGLTPVPAEARKAVDRLLPEPQVYDDLAEANRRESANWPSLPKFAVGGYMGRSAAEVLAADWSGYARPAVPQGEVDRRVSLAIRHLAAALGMGVEELVTLTITPAAVTVTVLEPGGTGDITMNTRRGATYTYRPTGWKQTKEEADE